MASSSSLLSEDQLQCSICLDVFTDPVSTPCGHNFCMICLRKYWNSSSHCQCPVCKREFPQRPELSINTFISGLAAQFKKSVQVKSSRAPEERSFKRKLVQCDSCSEKKLEAVKSCLDCGVSFCDSHLSLHKTTPKYKKHKLMDPVENLEDYICQKHERPLELFCRDDQTCVCQFCTEGDHRTHSTVPIEEESGEKKTQLEKTQAEVQQMIQERLKKIQEIKHSVELNKKIREKEKADSVEIFRALVRCIERSQAELLEVMEEKQKAAERQAEELIKELEQEITELKRRDTELEQISHTEDHLHLLQIYPSLCRPPHTKNWTDVSVNTPLSVESVRRALSQFQKRLTQVMQKIPEIMLTPRSSPQVVTPSFSPAPLPTFSSPSTIKPAPKISPQVVTPSFCFAPLPTFSSPSPIKPAPKISPQVVTPSFCFAPLPTFSSPSPIKPAPKISPQVVTPSFCFAPLPTFSSPSPIKPAPKISPQVVTPSLSPAPLPTFSSPSPIKPAPKISPQVVTPSLSPAPLPTFSSPSTIKPAPKISPQVVTPSLSPAPLPTFSSPSPIKPAPKISPQVVTPSLSPAPLPTFSSPSTMKPAPKISPQVVTPSLSPAPLPTFSSPSPIKPAPKISPQVVTPRVLSAPLLAPSLPSPIKPAPKISPQVVTPSRTSQPGDGEKS